MEIKDLKKLLESTEVEITFKSLKSGRTITEKCSLNKNTADKNLIAEKILEFFHDSN